MNYCKKCGSGIDDNTRFCPICGTAVQGTIVSSDQEYDKKTNTMALIGFILGVISLFLTLLGITGTIACLFSGIGIANFNPKTEKNKWMGVIGLLCGIISVIIAVIALTLIVAEW